MANSSQNVGFTSTRCQMAGKSDGAVSSAWVTSFGESHVSVRILRNKPLTIGEVFSFQLATHQVSAQFDASVLQVEAIDNAGTATVENVAGSNSQMDETPEITVVFQLIGSVRYRNNYHPVWFRLKAVNATLYIESEPVLVRCLEGSLDGVICLSVMPIETGAHVRIKMPLAQGEISVAGKVNSSEVDEYGTGKYRTEVIFEPLGRLERPKWDNHLQLSA